MYKQHQNVDESARMSYENALRRGTIRKIFSRFRHRCNDLVSASTILNQLQHQKRKDLGLQEVPIHQIVGSTGRYRDYDLAFLPRNKGTKDRWIKVANAFLQNSKMPPVSLIKVGDAYFVEDGNHRISVARFIGKRHIRARVIEVVSPSLKTEPSCTRLGFKVQGHTHHTAPLLEK